MSTAGRQVLASPVRREHHEAVAVTWSLFGLLASGMVAGFGVLLTAINRQGDRIDALGARIDAQGDSLRTRIDAQGEALTARVDAQGQALGARIEAQGQALAARIDRTNMRIDDLGARIDALASRA